MYQTGKYAIFTALYSAYEYDMSFEFCKFFGFAFHSDDGHAADGIISYY